jgi:plastocyanin
MKKKMFSALLMLFFAVVFTSCSSNTGSTNSTDATNSLTPAVSIENSSFKPSNLTVRKGATVEWTNNDTTVHNIKAAAFNSPDLEKGETFEFTFITAGTYDYSCGIHPTMKGKIIVVENKSTY